MEAEQRRDEVTEHSAHSHVQGLAPGFRMAIGTAPEYERFGVDVANARRAAGARVTVVGLRPGAQLSSRVLSAVARAWAQNQAANAIHQRVREPGSSPEARLGANNCGLFGLSRQVQADTGTSMLVVLCGMEALTTAGANARHRNFSEIKALISQVFDCRDGLNILCLGTPGSLFCTERGLHSHPSLRQMLTENPFARDGLVDQFSSVIRLGTNSQPSVAGVAAAWRRNPLSHSG